MLHRVNDYVKSKKNRQKNFQTKYFCLQLSA